MEVRTIDLGDLERYQSILDRTTDEDRYCRFFHAVDHFDPDEVRRFVEPDGNIVGFIAVDGERALGAAHAYLVDEKTAELAIVVANDSRRSGVGAALVTRLIAELRALGYRYVIAYALAENRAFAKLAKRVGMHSTGLKSSVVTWALEPDAAAA